MVLDECASSWLLFLNPDSEKKVSRNSLAIETVQLKTKQNKTPKTETNKTQKTSTKKLQEKLSDGQVLDLVTVNTQK